MQVNPMLIHLVRGYSVQTYINYHNVDKRVLATLNEKVDKILVIVGFCQRLSLWANFSLKTQIVCQQILFLSSFPAKS